MSRWASDPERAADELIGRALSSLDLRGRILLAYQAGELPDWLSSRGLHCQVWNRRVGARVEAAPWPPAGSFEAALLRLPKAKAEQEMAAHACLSVLARGGRLVVYGGNDEGVRSFTGLMVGACGEVETVVARGHGRVLRMRRPADPSRLRAELAAWRSVTSLQIGGIARNWVSYPGIFAAERLDEGTALLIGALPPLPEAARVLDYGCGSGTIGAAALAQAPTIALDLLDNDAVALEAAHENVPAARLALGATLADAGATRYDAILSNPPLHHRLTEDHALLEQLIADAPRHLAPAGVLQIVVQRRVPLDRLLARYFAAVTLPAENSRYRVWRARAQKA
jgi:16S rRNA (guanine1207-N2)-methyltransferase